MQVRQRGPAQGALQQAGEAHAILVGVPIQVRAPGFPRIAEGAQALPGEQVGRDGERNAGMTGRQESRVRHHKQAQRPYVGHTRIFDAAAQPVHFVRLLGLQGLAQTLDAHRPAGCVEEDAGAPDPRVVAFGDQAREEAIGADGAVRPTEVERAPGFMAVPGLRLHDDAEPLQMERRLCRWCDCDHGHGRLLQRVTHPLRILKE